MYKQKFIPIHQTQAQDIFVAGFIIALFEQEASEQLIQMGYKPVSGLF